MRKFIWFFTILICLIVFSGPVKSDDEGKIRLVKSSQDYKKDEILVKYKPSRSPLSEKAAQARSGFSEIKTFRKTGIKQIKITGDMDVQQALEVYRSDPNVAYAEPNYRYHISAVPNDPDFDKQWALENTGQVVNNYGGYQDADIDATDGWEVTTGGTDVIVAVIDSGVDYNHPDLSANIWINQGEIDTNGIDDDGNGKVDDIRGWDFVDSDNDPMDYNDHGTHVAGIIGAVGNNSIGVVGVAWTAKIMALRGLDTEGYGYASDLIEAIEYASENGADVINLSWGSEDYSQALKDAIDASPAFVVCAAGNERRNIDSAPVYPSSYDLSNIISVAATGQYDNLTEFSNYGKVAVDIGAPGENIYSTVPAREIIWSDNFDDGNISDWTSGGAQNNWGVTQSAYSSPSYSISESPVGYYNNNTNSWIRSPSFDLSSSKGARLDFKLRGLSESGYDILHVQVSSNATNWVDCELIDGSSGGEWIPFAVDLKDFEEKNTVYIRFVFISDDTYYFDGFYIDDISVSAFSNSFYGTEYQFMDGTSMAAPYVSGTAALLKAAIPELASTELKTAILDSVDSDTSLVNKVSSSGRLNAFNALQRVLPCDGQINVSLPAFVTEGDGILADNGSVSITFPVEKDIKVLLTSNDESEITVPYSVTIPAGETSVDFDITVLDDTILDGSKTVDIIFIKPGCPSKTGQIHVNDNETASFIFIVPETLHEASGVHKGIVRVAGNSAVEDDITVDLFSDKPDKITVPDSVIIRKGQSFAEFDITIIDNSVIDGSPLVTITASVLGWDTSSVTISITDDDSIYSIDETYSTNLTYIMRDDIRNNIYLADAANRQLIVINSKSLEVTLRLALDCTFSDMAISKDNSRMAIAGGSLYLIDLETFEKKRLAVDFEVGSVAFDRNNKLILQKYNQYIYCYNPDTETVTQTFGSGQDLTDTINEYGILRTDKDGDYLYVAEKALGNLFKFDISGETPNYLSENNYGNYIKDFVISPLYNEIYLTSTYYNGLQVINGDSLSVIENLEPDNYFSGVAIDPSGNYLYVFGTQNSILYQFDAETRELIFSYQMLGRYSYWSDLRNIAIDSTGEKAFIIYQEEGYESEFCVHAVDLNFPLTLTLPDNATETSGMLNNQGAVFLASPRSDDLTVFLESDDTTEVQVPGSVIIAAGQSSTFFSITILDDSYLDGTRSVTVTAIAQSYPPSKYVIDVVDNETAILTLAVPAIVAESVGLLFDQGVVSVNTPVDEDVDVHLRADNMGEIIFPGKVTIPAGQTTANFSLFVIDDTKVEGDNEITITASVEGWNQDQKIVIITDNESPEMRIFSNATFSEGDNVIYGGGTIEISGILPHDLEVTLSLDDNTEISVPSSVTIPAWQTFAQFDVTVLDDSEEDGIQTVTLSANAEGFPESSIDIDITDNDNNTQIDATYSTSLTYILRDDKRDIIYLADAGNSQLVVIDSISLDVIIRLPVDSNFRDMALSKDKNTLAIAGGTLYLVDLVTFETRQLVIDISVISVAFDHNGDLMLTSNLNEEVIYKYDPNIETVINTFGKAGDPNETGNGYRFLKTDADGKMLYVSRAFSLLKFDISGDIPTFITESNTNSDSSIVNDFIISPWNNEIYYVTNRPGFLIIDSDSLEILNQVEIDIDSSARFDGIIEGPNGYYIYGASNSDNILYQVDKSIDTTVFHYNLQLYGYPQRRGLAIDSTGQRAFIIQQFYEYYDPDYFKVQVVELNRPIKLFLPYSLSEGDGIRENHGVIKLLRPHAEDLEISLESNDTTEVQVPGYITIPAGQISATFDILIIDDQILDGTKSVSITASATELPPAAGSINIKDDEVATITLSAPDTVVEGDGRLRHSGVISVNTPVEDGVVVNLKIDNISEISLLNKIAIPAGQTSVAFDIIVFEDTIIEDTQEVTITAYVEGWNQDQKTISIIDNEVAELVLTVSNTFCEGDDPESYGNVITIPGVLPYDLEVALSSNDTTEITVPSSVTIPAGESSTKFNISTVDDTEEDGIKVVDITASADGFSESKVKIMVSDNDNVEWIEDTSSTNLTGIMRDDLRDLVYLADAANKQLVVINSKTLDIIRRVPLDSTFMDIAISKDGQYIAISGKSLYLINLDTFETRKLSTSLDVLSVAFDHSGNLMLLTRKAEDFIYHFNPVTETVIRSFGTGNDFLDKIENRSSFLKTDIRGNILYVSENNSFLNVFDISDELPFFLEERECQCRDIAGSPLHNETYLANRYTNIIDNNTYELLETPEPWNYPVGISTDVEGYYLYYSDYLDKALYQIDTYQKNRILHYNLLSEDDSDGPRIKGLTIDRTGQRAFIIYGPLYSDDMPNKVQVVELSKPFKLSLPASSNEQDGVIKGGGIISLVRAFSEDMIVYLESNDVTEVQVPDFVVIQAGQFSKSFDITVVDDSLIDGTQEVSITATVPGSYIATMTLPVNDSETNTINLTMPNSVCEGDIFNEREAVITTEFPVDTDVRINPQSSDGSEITVPYMVIIPTGHDSVTFSFSTVADSLMDGFQTSTITASVEGWKAGTFIINVQDIDEVLIVDIVQYLKEGDGFLANAGRVSIVEPVDYDLAISLSSSDTSDLEVTESLTIPAGETSSAFDITVIDDHILDGTQLLTITASAGNFNSGDSTVTIFDSENKSSVPPWTTYQGNSSHTGYVPVTLESHFTKRWVKDLSNKALRPVTAADGRVFVSTADPHHIGDGLYYNSLLVLMAESGNVIWEKVYDGPVKTYPPAYNNGKIFIQTYFWPGCYLEAYIAATGEEIFKNEYSSQSNESYAPTVYDDNVYIYGGHYGGAYAFDSITGDELWFTDLPQYDSWTPAVNEEYVFFYTQGLFILNRQSGDLEYSITDVNFDWHGWSVEVAPVIGSENNIIVTQEGRLINFDLSAQEIGWELNEDFYGQPSLANGRIYTIESGLLGVRDESDGSLIWSWESPYGDLTGNIIVTDSHIFTSTDNTTYAIDIKTQMEVWNYPSGGHLALGEGMLYIATNSGTLIAIDVFADDDEDGMPNEWEILYGLNPLLDDSSEDKDGDGFTNLDEYIAGTDPGNKNDHPNNPPVAYEQTVYADEDTVLEISLSASDAEGDSLTYMIVDQVEHGMLTGDGPNLVYTPDADYHGQDSFSFKTYDGLAYSNVAIVTINISPVNDPPIAYSKSVRMVKGRLLDVLLTGRDPEKDSLTFHIVAHPSNGSLSGTPPNLVYTSNSDFSGSDSFTFKVNDDSLDSNVAEISIQVLDKAPPGDIEGSAYLELRDAILALQLSANIATNTEVYKEADVNGDGRIGVEEVIFVLRKVTGMGEE